VILVDSSVCIDFFRNRPTVQAEWLDKNLGVEGLVVGDLILAEVLRGFKDDRGFNGSSPAAWPVATAFFGRRRTFESCVPEG
jgi:predicted nucleic acid-binding protein